MRIGPLQIRRAPLGPSDLAASFSTAYVRRSHTHTVSVVVGHIEVLPPSIRPAIPPEDVREHRPTPRTTRRETRIQSGAFFVLFVATTARAQTGRITGIIADSAQDFRSQA